MTSLLAFRSNAIAQTYPTKPLRIVAKSNPDGYTLLLMSNANAVSAGLFQSLPFNPAIAIRNP